jgi:hypothetical protein
MGTIYHRLTSGGERVNTNLLYRFDTWLVCLILLVLLLVALEAGFRVGRRTRPLMVEGDRSAATTVIASVLGLLALLLGFSFSMAMARYDARYELVVHEANTVGTTFLRAKMLPEPRRTRVARLLRNYVDVRASRAAAGRDQIAFENAVRESERLQKRIWAHAIEAVRTDPKPVPTGLFVQTLNDMIDDHAKRLAAMRNHVPALIYLILYSVAIGAMGLAGYGCGLAGRRNLLATVTAAVLITLVVFAITDLDRPRTGWIRVSQQSILDLRDSMDRDPIFSHTTGR